MRPFVESLRRLYLNEKIQKDNINAFYIKGSITKVEKDYILSKKD